MSLLDKIWLYTLSGIHIHASLNGTLSIEIQKGEFENEIYLAKSFADNISIRVNAQIHKYQTYLKNWKNIWLQLQQLAQVE